MKENIKKLIKKQIGREPEGMVEVSLTCPFDYPAVIKVYPFFMGRVFPTLYWLTCPYLIKEVAILEDESWINKIQIKINQDNDLKEKLRTAHKYYAKKRYELLDEKEINDIKNISEGIIDTLKNSGIGGIKEKEGIKCLHTHLADYLVNKNNPVGEIVFKKAKWPKSCNICEELRSDD